MKEQQSTIKFAKVDQILDEGFSKSVVKRRYGDKENVIVDARTWLDQSIMVIFERLAFKNGKTNDIADT